MEREFIKVSYGVIGQIATDLNMSRQTITKALRNNQKVQKLSLIRTMALERGGEVYMIKKKEM